MLDSPDFKVLLETFQGPLDLLLYLVKRDEVDILDIPIARVAGQFKRYLDLLTLIDVERAGDFLVMAATLMEIKSKMLLPGRKSVEQPEEDPRRELVRQLLQYKRFKEAAGVLEQRAEEQAQRLSRTSPEAVAPRTVRGSAPALKPVELWDLVSAFGRLMRETLTLQAQTITVDHTPLHVHMDAVLSALLEAKTLPLSALFIPPHTRSRLVGLFLAILELAKVRSIVPEQPEAFGDLWVTLVEGAPARPEDGQPRG
jgi:segregation and condensation protein A